MKQIVEVVAALIFAEGRILAAQRGSGAFKGLWEFPGGKIEATERPEAALIREIKEELNLDIEVGEFFRLIEYEYEEFTLSMRCYICSLKSETLTLSEHLAYVWLRMGQLDSIDWLPADREIISDLRKRFP